MSENRANTSATPTRVVRLGVNVDHVATLRQARGTSYPDPVFAAALAESAGADQITIHLREDRRHILDRDLEVMRRTVRRIPLNLEMAATADMVRIALAQLPDIVTLVPERREERTTEGGLDVAGQRATLMPHVQALRDAGIIVSMFIDPDEAQITASAQVGATVIELHTGDYAEAATASLRARELERLRYGAVVGHDVGLAVAAGHGLDLRNVGAVAALEYVEELNIGHSIVARAVFIGLEAAVVEMRRAVAEAVR